MKSSMQELRNDILIEMQLGIIGEHSGNRVLHYIDTLYLDQEKEQIKKANLDGYKEGCTYHSFDHKPITSEQYYKQTYNNENN